MRKIGLLITMALMLALGGSASEVEDAVESADEVISSELSGDPGITPDNPLWEIETAMENVNLALTFGDEAKARKRAQMARERLLEAKLMAERQNIKALEKAQRLHLKHLEKLRERLQKAEGSNFRSELKTDIELEKDLESQEEAVTALSITVKARGNLSEEQSRKLEALFESLKEEAHKTKIEVRAGRERVKLKIRAKEAISKENADLIDDQLEVEVEAESKGRGEQTVAEQFIRIAEEAIGHAEEKLASGSNETSAKAGFHMGNAKAALQKAREAFREKNYNDARSLALEARREALASFTISSGREATTERVMEVKEEISERRLKALEAATEKMDEMRQANATKVKEERIEKRESKDDEKIEVRKGSEEKQIRKESEEKNKGSEEKNEKGKSDRGDSGKRGKLTGNN